MKDAVETGVLWTTTAYFRPPEKQELGLQQNEIRPYFIAPPKILDGGTEISLESKKDLETKQKCFQESLRFLRRRAVQ